MKNNILLFVLSVLVFFSCSKNTVDPIFDKTPEVRVEETLLRYNNILTSAPFGWKATYYPDNSEAGGYSFYMNFDKSNKVKMYSDFTGGTALRPSFSSFQVKQLSKPSLVFDTFGYLNIFIEPGLEPYGEGFKGDQEFIFINANDSKIILKGTKNATDLVLTALTAEEKKSLENGDLNNIIIKSFDYYQSEGFDFITLGTRKIDFSIDFESKKVTAYLPSNNGLTIVSEAFYFTLTGIKLKNSIDVLGNEIEELIWDNTNKSYYALIGTLRAYVQKSPRPSMPLFQALGSIVTGFSLDPTLPTQNSSYTVFFKQLKDSLNKKTSTAPPRVLTGIRLAFLPSGVVYLVFDYYRVENSSIAGILAYSPSIDANNNFSFNFEDGNLVPEAKLGLKAFIDIFEKDKFSIAYDPVVPSQVIFKSISRPNFEIKGKLF